MIRGWLSYLIGRWLCGCLAIPTPRLQMQTTRSRKAREIGQAARLMYALYCASTNPVTAAEITRQQTR